MHRNDRADRDHAEPHAHHRPEESGNARGAARLHGKQREQDHHRDRHDIGFECRGDELDALDRRKHRECRRDHRVAVKQGAADDAEQNDGAAAIAHGALRERHQRQRPALAMVVGAEQDEHVFQRHHDDQRPQDQRQHAEHGLRIDGRLLAAGRDHGLAQRIERAGTDVAIDDTDAAEHECLESGGGMGVAMAIRRRGFRGGGGDITHHESGGLKKCFTAQWQSDAAYSPALKA